MFKYSLENKSLNAAFTNFVFFFKIFYFVLVIKLVSPSCNSMADSCQCMIKPTEMLWSN